MKIRNYLLKFSYIFRYFLFSFLFFIFFFFISFIMLRGENFNILMKLLTVSFTFPY